MIGTVIDEIRASAVADLPGHITAIATLRGVTLTSTFELNDWWEDEVELLRTLNPWALGVRWESSTSGVGRNFPAHTHADHRIHLVGAYKGTDLTVIKTHMMYLPEAVVRWLRNFPTSSRSAGKTIHIVDPPDAGGVTIEHDLLLARPEPAVGSSAVVTTYVWGFDVSGVVRAVDTA